jgi:hypothetical protein
VDMFWSVVVARNGDVTSVIGDVLAGCFCPSISSGASESYVISPLGKKIGINKVMITCTGVLVVPSLSMGQ